MPKKVLIALPPAMLEQVDFIASCEHRTRSDLIREALRRYLDNFRRSQQSHMTVIETAPRAHEAPPPVRPAEPVKNETKTTPVAFFTNERQFNTTKLDPGSAQGAHT